MREDVERADRWRRPELALRFGGSVTGVGAGAGILYLTGSDTVLTAPVSASMLLVGLALLLVGHRARRHPTRG